MSVKTCSCWYTDMAHFATLFDLVKWFVAENLETYETSRHFYMRVYVNDHHDIIIRRSKVDLDIPLGWTEVAHIFPDKVITSCRRNGEWCSFER